MRSKFVMSIGSRASIFLVLIGSFLGFYIHHSHGMRFLISADETGNVKEVICQEGTDTSQKEGAQPELIRSVLEASEHVNVKNRVREMTMLKDGRLAVARLNGYVDIHDVSNRESDDFGKLLRSYKLQGEAGDKPIALIELESLNFIMVAFESGSVFIIDVTDDIEPIHIILPSRTKENNTISAFSMNPYSPGIVAYGGKNNDLQVAKLFDLKLLEKDRQKRKDPSYWKPKVLFQAENVEPDHLGLDVPIWITGILFRKMDRSKGFRLVTSTWYGHIREYDTLIELEPVASYKVCEKPINALKFATSSQEDIVIADTHTFVARLSLVKVDAKAIRIVSASAGTFYRPSLKVLGKYSQGGNTGAINSIVSSPCTDAIATGGLDRYLRVFDVQTRRLLAKVYLGTQIGSILFLEDDSSSAIDKESVQEAEDLQNDEDLWQQLEASEDSQDKPLITKRRRRV